MTDLHPIQQEMLRIEKEFERKAPPPVQGIDQCMADMVEWGGSIEDFDEILRQETSRALRLLQGHYSEYADMTPQMAATVLFMQGVTFARAAANVREAESQRDAARSA